MADVIKTVLFNYACCAFAGGFMEYVLPGKARGMLRGIVAVVLILSVALPVIDSAVEIPDFVPQYVENENQTVDSLMHTANLTERKIKKEVQEILINEGVNEYEIYVSTTVDEESVTVFLESVYIEIGKAFEDKKDSILQKITGDYKSVTKIGVKNE